MDFVWIGVFGLVGVFSRYGLDRLAQRWVSAFPFGTLGINLLGSFLAGLLFVVGTEKAHLPPELRIGLMVGLLGGFTTFSAFALQSARLLETGEIGPAALYLVGSPLLGLGAALLGLTLGRAIS
ncbi:MAG: fluoride efflux transporter FluC [Bdellovibrionota bacterium]